MIKGIIFDADGVLLDSLKIWNDLGARYLRSIGNEPEEGLNAILFPMSMEEGAEYLKKRYSLQKTEQEIISGIEAMLDRFYFEEVELKPGVRDAIGAFKKMGLRLSVATASPRKHVEAALKRNGIYTSFDVMYTISEIGEGKNSSLIYDKAAEAMGLKTKELAGFKSAECIVIEDSFAALRTAKAAGYRTVGIYDADGETDQDGLKKEADVYLRDLSDISEIIRLIKTSD